MDGRAEMGLYGKRFRDEKAEVLKLLLALRDEEEEEEEEAEIANTGEDRVAAAILRGCCREFKPKKKKKKIEIKTGIWYFD